MTSDPRRLSHSADMRTSDGKRFVDIFSVVEGEFPGADLSRIREISLLRFRLEQALTAGTCSLENVVRMSNLARRCERALHLETKRKAETAASPLSFRDRLLARRSGGGAP